MLKVAAVLNGQPQLFEPAAFVFPGGESQVTVPAELQRIAPELASVRIHALLKSANDVMQLLLLTDALRRLNPCLALHLDMPYVPYARQDRVCSPGEALGAAVFCRLVNGQDYASVTVVEPHSDVTPALLQRARIVDASVFLAATLRFPEFTQGVTLLAPDAGASKRVQALGKKLGVPDVLFAQKVRDPRTGRITETRAPDAIPEQPILIVDDICDGGRTFLELARALRVKTTQPLYLYVTHGIFSHGFEELNALYERIYTAYDWTKTPASSGPTLINEGSPV